MGMNLVGLIIVVFAVAFITKAMGLSPEAMAVGIGISVGAYLLSVCAAW